MSHEKKEYIEGIYNYCDRWCEKCGFTANCLLFTEESKIKTYEILHNGDLTGMGKVFKKEIDDMQNEIADDDEADEFTDDEFFESLNDKADNESFDLSGQEIEKPEHPINDLVDDYFIKAHSLVESLDDKFKLMERPRNTIEGSPAEKIFNDFEVFMWYYTFIGAKIKRAMYGLYEADKVEDSELREIHMYDVNGSAKIGIISIRKSIDALNNLNNALPEYSAETEEILILLGKILNLAEELFPDCMQFKRPGLDK